MLAFPLDIKKTNWSVADQDNWVVEHTHTHTHTHRQRYTRQNRRHHHRHHKCWRHQS